MKPGVVRSLQKQAAIYLLDHRHEIKLHHAIHTGQTSAHMNAVLVRVVQNRLDFLDDILIDLYRRYHFDSDILKTDAMVMEDRAEKVRWLSMVIRHRRRPTETSLQRMRIFYAVNPKLARDIEPWGVQQIERFKRRCAREILMPAATYNERVGCLQEKWDVIHAIEAEVDEIALVSDALQLVRLRRSIAENQERAQALVDKTRAAKLGSLTGDTDSSASEESLERGPSQEESGATVSSGGRTCVVS